MNKKIEAVKHVLYELYKAEWMRRVSFERSIREEYMNYFSILKEHGYDTDSYTLQEHINEYGYGGQLYVCYDEFCQTELYDKDYIGYLSNGNKEIMSCMEKYWSSLSVVDDDPSEKEEDKQKVKAIRVANIKWDTDGEAVDHLPENVSIDKPSDDFVKDAKADSSVIADYLSDEFGFCIISFDYFFEEEIEEKEMNFEEKTQWLRNQIGSVPGVFDDKKAIEFYFRAVHDFGFSLIDADDYAYLKTLFGYDIGAENAKKIIRWFYEKINSSVEEAVLAAQKGALKNICELELGLYLDFSRFASEQPKCYKYFLPSSRECADDKAGEPVLCGFIFRHGDKDLSVWEPSIPDEAMREIEEILAQYRDTGACVRNVWDNKFSDLF